MMSTYGSASPPDPFEADSLTQDRRPQPTALFVVEHGFHVTARFLLDRPIMVIGHDPETDILLDDVTVSRRHATVERLDALFSLRDLGSVNGTYVNGRRIEDTILMPADRVQIGKFLLRFEPLWPPLRPI